MYNIHDSIHDCLSKFYIIKFYTLTLYIEHTGKWNDKEDVYKYIHYYIQCT